MRNDKKILMGGAVFFVAAVVSFIVPTVVLSIVQSTAGRGSTAFYVINHIVSFVTQILFAATVLVVMRITKTKPDFGFKHSGVISYAGGLAVAVIGVVCFYLLSSLFAFGLGGMGYKSSGGSFESTSDWVVNSIRVLLFAPVCEEILFRSGVLSGTSSLTSGRKRGKLWSIILCGALFMLLHMNPEQTVYQFLFGCTLAMLTIASGSVIPAIIAHFANNGIALILEAPFASGLGGWIATFFETMPALFVVLAVLTAAIAFAAVCVLCRLIRTRSPARLRMNENPGPEVIDKHARMTGIALFSVGAGICLIVWIIQLASNIASAVA